MRVFLMNQVPAWIVDGLAREGWLGQPVDDPAQVPVDAALVLVGAPHRALILALHRQAPEAAVVGCGAADGTVAELIAVGVDDLLPTPPPVDAATRLALVAQRALRRPAGVSAFGDVLELVLFRASAATGDVQFINDAAFRAGLARTSARARAGARRSIPTTSTRSSGGVRPPWPARPRASSIGWRAATAPSAGSGRRCGGSATACSAACSTSPPSATSSGRCPSSPTNGGPSSTACRWG